MAMIFINSLRVLERMITNIKTQYNRATAYPVFCVQEKNRIYGVEKGYTNSFVWVNEEDDGEREEYEQDTKKYREVEALDEVPDNWRKVGYDEYYYTIQAFFTEIAASEYIEKNQHRLMSPRIYVDSAYRNYEWQAIRALLQNEELTDVLKSFIDKKRKE